MGNLDLIKIAELAGVSRSTVSRVINEQPNVSPEVRLRVQKIIHETGFQPNLAARSLRSKQSDVIGLVICNTVTQLFTDPYFPELTQGVAQGCNQHDKTLALFLEGDPDVIFPRLTRRGHLDGLLLQVGKTDDYLVKRLLETDVPFIVLGRPVETRASNIDIDNVGGGYLATAHLLRLGRKRVGTITGALDTTAGLDRKEGYQRALAERGAASCEELVAEGDFSVKGGYYAMQRLLKHRPDGLFIASDGMARGAIQAIREAGLSVPQDISIVGFDDLPYAVDGSPTLTTIRQPIANFGIRAIEALLDSIDYGPQPVKHIMLDVELVIRESCGGNLY